MIFTILKTKTRLITMKSNESLPNHCGQHRAPPPPPPFQNLWIRPLLSDDYYQHLAVTQMH